ncbi:hypothetical protein [Chromobacterium alticapitis]|uniref:hypothetical protein n=1 Tax=Chromobacterium alticapitis TaxID=2073169 RepID=UPI0011B001EE|nr:hypothetical protein [Chromobacterium alticapitis]
MSSLLIALLLLWPIPAAAPAPAPEDPQHAGYWHSVAAHVYALLPLWAGHIALGREQIDDAAGQLTIRFDAMLSQLGGSQDPAADPAHPVIAAQGALSDALETLQLPPPLQKRLQPQVQQLKQAGRQLAEMVQNLLGTADSPPSAIEKINEQARQLLRQLESLDGDIHASCHSCKLRMDGAPSSVDLQTTIQEVLIHLQFQDRVSQILSHVQNDIWQLETMLHEALHSGGDALPEPPDTEAWLNALKNSYTTHEQRALHNREHNDKTPGASDITFF